MGSLFPTVAQIREPHLDFVLDHFTGGGALAEDSPADPGEPEPFDLNTEAERIVEWQPEGQAAHFVAAFLSRFPGVANDPTAVRRLEGFVKETEVQIAEERAWRQRESPDESPCWSRENWARETAFWAIVSCCSRDIETGISLANQGRSEGYWELLGEVCGDETERAQVDTLRKLLLDRSFHGDLQRALSGNDFDIALLRPGEVRRLPQAVALVERLHRAIPPGKLRYPELLEDDLRDLSAYLGSIEGEDTCLLCWAYG